MAFPFDLVQQTIPSASSSTSLMFPEGQKTTLWMGELEPWMDEHYLRQLWFNLNEKVMVKVIRDKVTGASAGYAFVDFGSAANAQRALTTFNGTLIPNTHKLFKLNWASGGGLIDRREDRQPEYSIFVGDLGPDITELSLLTVFQTRYRSCKSAKIMTDPRTGLTRGYGFVRFTDINDQQRALVEMQGFCFGSRPIRVSVATPKSRMHSNVASPPTKSPLQSPVNFVDPTNTTVFVGGLSSPIREDELRHYFSPFGEITQVKIPPGKGCGFVQFASRQSAEMAIQQMNGFQIGNSRVRLSWGRSQNDRLLQQQQQQHQQQQQQPLLSTVHQLPPPALPTLSNLPRSPIYQTPSLTNQHAMSYSMLPPALALQQPVRESGIGYALSPHTKLATVSSPHAALTQFDSVMGNPLNSAIASEDSLLAARSLLDKKATSAAAWRLNQVYAQ